MFWTKRISHIYVDFGIVWLLSYKSSNMEIPTTNRRFIKINCNSTLKFRNLRFYGEHRPRWSSDRVAVKCWLILLNSLNCPPDQRSFPIKSSIAHSVDLAKEDFLYFDTFSNFQICTFSLCCACLRKLPRFKHKHELLSIDCPSTNLPSLWHI